ncbi:MAG: serine hydrolase, partial [Proteobacteria bacterium]|nr:serine hydrolase [Pseudomonadota bacterium]
NDYLNGPVKPLAYEPMDAIADYVVATPDGPLSFASFLDSDQSTAMGVVILHHGEIVVERYPRMQEYEKPVYWSVAKIFVSTVIRIFEERGLIDVSLPIETYIPEINNSSFAGISVRDILDMATGLDCAEEYVLRDACYYRYSMAIGDGFRTEDAPDNPYDFVATLQAEKVDEPGEKFSYSGLNTFVLAWLVEKVTDMLFQDVFTREIWYHIGAEADASYIAPRYGIPVTHGGFLARMRDVARFGLLFTPSYHVVSDIRIISDEHLALIDSGGRPELRANAGMPPVSESGIKHNVYQWDRVYKNNDVYKGGWAGQGLLFNPTRDLVVVYVGYMKDDKASEMSVLTPLRKILDSLYGGD